MSISIGDTTLFILWHEAPNSLGYEIAHVSTLRHFAKQGDIAHDGTNLLVSTIKREWAKWRTIGDAMENDGMTIIT